MSKKVSAIVLNYRSPQLTVRCVQSLLKQSLIQQMEIIVVDNHSEDDSIGVLRNRLSAFPEVRLVETAKNIGYGKGNTKGASLAQGEYVLIINPDNELQHDGVEQLAQRMEEQPTIGIIAPKLLHPDGTVRESFRTFPTLLDVIVKRTFLRQLFPERMRRFLHEDKEYTESTDVDWVVGACFLIRRADFDLLGGFDPRFFLFFEDTDLCRRMWKTGKRVVYEPGVTARDQKQRLSGQGFFSIFLTRIGWIHLQSACKYFWKWSFR